jgi:hypothetical protein
MGHWGGSRSPRTHGNARTGPVFHCLLVIVRPWKKARRSVTFRYFALGAVVVCVQ